MNDRCAEIPATRRGPKVAVRLCALGPRRPQPLPLPYVFQSAFDVSEWNRITLLTYQPATQISQSHTKLRPR